MTSLQYLLTFAPMLDNFKSVPIDKKFGDLIVHWSINVQKKFKKNLSTNFVLIAVSVKVALTQYRNTVRKFCNIANYRAKIDETPIDLHRFVNGHVYFKLYLSRVFVYLKHVCTGNQPLTLRENVRRPWSVQRPKSPVIRCTANFVIDCVKKKKKRVQYRNIVNPKVPLHVHGRNYERKKKIKVWSLNSSLLPGCRHFCSISKVHQLMIIGMFSKFQWHSVITR